MIRNVQVLLFRRLHIKDRSGPSRPTGRLLIRGCRLNERKGPDKRNSLVRTDAWDLKGKRRTTKTQHTQAGLARTAQKMLLLTLSRRRRNEESSGRGHNKNASRSDSQDFTRVPHAASPSNLLDVSPKACKAIICIAPYVQSNTSHQNHHKQQQRIVLTRAPRQSIGDAFLSRSRPPSTTGHSTPVPANQAPRQRVQKTNKT